MTAAKPDPIPARYRRVTPCLIVRGGDKALDFYAAVFGATERMRFPGPDGSVAHAEIEIGDSVVMCGEPAPERGWGPMPAALSIYVDDAAAVDAAYRRALELGAQSVAEPTNQFYGHRSATVKDVAGNKWTVGTVIEELTKEQILRRMQDMAKGG